MEKGGRLRLIPVDPCFCIVLNLMSLKRGEGSGIIFNGLVVEKAPEAGWSAMAQEKVDCCNS